MSKQELTKRAFSLIANTTANVAINDALAKSVSKRYTDSGRRVKGTKEKIFTKEEAIEMGVSSVARALPALNIAMKMKVSKARAERARNESVFNRWGQNILSEKTDHVVWQSDDLKYAVIDNR